MEREAPSSRLRRGAAARVRTLLGLLLLVLIASTGSVSSNTNGVVSSSQSLLVSALEQQTSMLYARGARLLNDARLLYEIRSLLREPAATGTGAADNYTRRQEPAKTCNKRPVTSGRA